MIQVVSPEQMFAGLGSCIVWIPVAALVMMFGGWMIQGDVDAILAVCGMFGAVALGYFTMRPPAPELGSTFLGLTILSAIMIPTANRVLSRIEFVRIDEEAARRAYEQLSQSKSNWIARFKLASLMHERGYSAHAVEIGMEALSIAPRGAMNEEQRDVARWSRSVYERAKPIRCMECGADNVANSLWCEKCNSELLIPYIGNRFVAKSKLIRLFAAWLIIIIGIAIIPATASTLPNQWVIPVILIEICIIVLVSVRAFVLKGGATSDN